MLTQGKIKNIKNNRFVVFFVLSRRKTSWVRSFYSLFLFVYLDYTVIFNHCTIRATSVMSGAKRSQYITRSPAKSKRICILSNLNPSRNDKTIIYQLRNDMNIIKYHRCQSNKNCCQIPWNLWLTEAPPGTTKAPLVALRAINV